jgi:hypothetical protein
MQATSEPEAEAVQVAAEMPMQLEQMQPVEGYQVVVERPVFNQSRRPEIDTGTSVQEEMVDEPVTEVAPLEVKLTGVVLTPEMRVVTLTPKDSTEALIVREGSSLEGQQVGWSVSQVQARQVTLDSADGRTMNLELSIHDQMIAEPPKPEPPPELRTSQEGEAVGEDGEPLSRAEEIRQRIQERREQLRDEAEANAETETEQKADTRQSYQEVIRNMMQRRPQKKEEESSEEDE